MHVLNAPEALTSPAEPGVPGSTTNLSSIPLDFPLGAADHQHRAANVLLGAASTAPAAFLCLCVPYGGVVCVIPHSWGPSHTARVPLAQPGSLWHSQGPLGCHTLSQAAGGQCWLFLEGSSLSSLSLQGIPLSWEREWSLLAFTCLTWGKGKKTKSRKSYKVIF